MRRLPCMDILRNQKADLFAVAAGRPDPSGKRPRATISHMTSQWVQEMEAEHIRAGTVKWLP